MKSLNRFRVHPGDKVGVLAPASGKGIHKALRQVFGDRAVIQRCVVHKLRNVRDHLPETRRAYVGRQMRDAYKSRSAGVAKKKLLQLASWLDSNGEDGAAASLREGLDETLTVLRLGLPPTLCRTFSTTNAIENMNGTLRRICRNVKRWRGQKMIQRWVAPASPKLSASSAASRVTTRCLPSSPPSVRPPPSHHPGEEDQGSVVFIPPPLHELQQRVGHSRRMAAALYYVQPAAGGEPERRSFRRKRVLHVAGDRFTK